MSERLNIKNLVIEPEKKPGMPFNPYRDLSQEDLGTVKRELATLPGTSAALDLSRMIFLGKGWFGDLDEHRRLLHEEQTRTPFANFDMKVLYEAQARVLGSPPVSQFGLQDIIDRQESYRQSGKSHNWGALFRLASAARLLGFPIALQPSDWSEMKSQLHQVMPDLLRSTHPAERETAIALVTWMTICGAKTVSVSPGGGLKLDFGEKEDTKTTPPMPEPRRF